MFMRILNLTAFSVLIMIIFDATSAWARYKVQIENNFQTWVAPSPEVQMAREGKDDQLGLARIFVPVMTHYETEPLFHVYKNGKPFRLKNPIGKSLFVEPGQYTIYIGNCSIENCKIKKTVSLKNGETKIIYPDWSGLIVRIIEPTRKYLVQSYEIFNMKNKESMGISISKDETEPGEKQETWLLPPGRYKITKAGYPFNTAINFSTVDLLPGQLYQWTIVMDEYSSHFVGAGFLEEMRHKTLNKTHLTIFSSLGGSFNVFHSNRQQKENFNTTLNAAIDFDNRLQFDNGTHFILMEPSYNLILSQEKGREMQIYSDKFIADNIYIYYLNRMFGFYGRADMQSKFFPDTIYFSSDKDTLQTVDTNGNTTHHTNVSDFQLSPAFYPLFLKEGTGINFTPFRTSDLRFSLRTGIGFRQSIYKNSYESSTNSDSVYKELDSLYLAGYELTGRLYMRLFYKLLFSLKYDILFPFEDTKNIHTELDAILSYRLLKFFSLEYTFSFKQGQGRSYAVLENNFWLKFSYIFY